MNSPRRRMSEKAEETGNVEGTARPPLWSAPLIYPSRCSAKMANGHASEGQISGPLIDVLRSSKGFHFKCLRTSQTRMVRTSNSSRNNVDKAQIDGALRKALSAHFATVFKKTVSLPNVHMIIAVGVSATLWTKFFHLPIRSGQTTGKTGVLST